MVFLACIISPPALMDDVDAVHGQISRNMLQSGDWTVLRLNGVPYLEKAPLLYWLISFCYMIFGVHDWAARIPIALSAMLLCWTTARYGAWAFGRRAGFYAGLALATCIGLFLFTRILLPDAMLTLAICACFFAFQRALNEDGQEPHPRRWAALRPWHWAVGVLLKGLLALVVPMGGALLYLAFTRQLFARRTWQRLHVVSGALIFLVIAAPWHVWPRCACRPISTFHCIAARASITDFSGFTSSMSTCCAFSGCAIRATTIPCSARPSGS